MDSKILFGTATNLILGGILISSWSFGIDGTVTTAIIGLIGVITGTILGFRFGKGE
jgi:hypothetical protein